MKKLLLMLASIGLVLGILSACGGKETGKTNGDNAGGKDKSEEPVTIKLHTHGTEDGYAWKKTIEAFEKEHENIKVDVVQLSEKQDSSEALQKIDLAAASGEQMDVIMFSNPAAYAQRVALDMLEPLDELIERDGYEMKEEYKFSTKVGDHYYGLPGKSVSWYVLLNKDHLDAAGLEVPKSWTWEEFMDYAKKLTTNDRFGTYFHGPQNGAWINYMSLKLYSKETDASFIKVDGTSNIDDPMYKESLALRVKMEKEDKSAVPYATMISQQMNYRDIFFTQGTSMIVTGNWMTAEIGGSSRFPIDFNIAVAPMPQNEPNSDEAFQVVEGDVLGISANSKHKEAAYTFIRWFSTEGQIAQGLNIPAWKTVSDDQLVGLIDTILENAASPEKVDKESLVHSIQIAHSAVVGEPLPYDMEINQALSVEFEKLILDKQDLDTTVENSKKVVQEIIDKNK
ncbi:sugar ABC transporter substrate-binding protein [Bacillus sp. FJAT-50079]|uniref:ABC transporter substrate-binding protein n=1 Tax=Bacillus sp. FJAT-50079 TaxID=2833577 RepID=UPI001BC97A37|nr:sugar ABC transporter substrate-binding protein [Bacillus sp. FJAT-50079]MBS4210168.1 sugar ABC transporter substrate-binding protein [Bacillus sp. FJAT-50079]